MALQLCCGRSSSSAHKSVFQVCRTHWKGFQWGSRLPRAHPGKTNSQVTVKARPPSLPSCIWPISKPTLSPLGLHFPAEAFLSLATPTSALLPTHLRFQTIKSGYSTPKVKYQKLTNKQKRNLQWEKSLVILQNKILIITPGFLLDTFHFIKKRKKKQLIIW